MKDQNGLDVDHGHLGHFLVDVKKNYKKWTPKTKTLSNRLKKNFSFNAMKNLLIEILDKNVNVPTQVKLNIPKLNGGALPTLKKV